MSILDGLPHAPVERFVNAVILVAEKRQARFIAIAGTRVRLWIDGEWHDEVDVPDQVATAMVRRLGVLIGVLPPGPDRWIAGPLVVAIGADRRIHCRVLIERDTALSALVELVTEAELAENVRPLYPSAHPYRS